MEAAGAFELLVPIHSTTVVCGAQVEHREQECRGPLEGKGG